nr:hypothetical protein [Tanacetum cinerariifolium]
VAEEVSADRVAGLDAVDGHSAGRAALDGHGADRIAGQVAADLAAGEVAVRVDGKPEGHLKTPRLFP